MSAFPVFTICATLLAYVGPGAGLSAIGAFLALLAGIVLAIFGFVWYPIKRLMKRDSKDDPAAESKDAKDDDA